jgi:hypothetical protein
MLGVPRRRPRAAQHRRVAAFVFDPSVYIGFTERDRGKPRDTLPAVLVLFSATETIVPFVGSGFVGPLDDYVDRFLVPLEAGMLFAVDQNIDLGFRASLRKPVGARRRG